MFLDGLAKVSCEYFIIRYPESVWPISDLLKWPTVLFCHVPLILMVMANSSMRNLALQPLETLYLHFHSTHDIQTWHGCDLPWGVSTHNIMWSFNHVVLWTQVTNSYIATFTRQMATKHGKVLTYGEGLPSVKSQNPLNKWSREVTLQTKNIKSLLSQGLWSPNLSGCWDTARSSNP